MTSKYVNIVNILWQLIILQENKILFGPNRPKQNNSVKNEYIQLFNLTIYGTRLYILETSIIDGDSAKTLFCLLYGHESLHCVQ